MKHLLSFIVICIARLVAGLPRLHYIEDDLASISQKSGLRSGALDRNSEKLDEELIPRANLKDSGGKGNQIAIVQKTPPAIQSLPKEKPETASITPNRQTGADSSAQKHPKAVSKRLAPHEPSAKQNSKTEIQSSPKQKSGNGIQSTNTQKIKSGSKQLYIGNQALPSKQQNKASSTTKNAHVNSARGKNSPSITKDSANIKHRQQTGKKASSDSRKISSKSPSQRKRLCRRTNSRQSCKWDLEEGGGGLQDQPDTSKPDTAPTMISQMSRAGKDFARAHPWTSTSLGLGASSAFLGNAAGVTDQCCHEACAKSAAHFLNYCGMTAGVAGAGIAFAGAVVAHQQRQKEREEHTREVEGLKMKTEGHSAAIEDHGRKIEQTNQRFSGELARTKQTLTQVTKRIGGPRFSDDMT